jgi:alpha-aminoadipate carrier protein LysW
MNNMQKAKCPMCGADVKVGTKPTMGQLVTCHNCAAELEVVWLEPVELDWPMDEYELETEGEYYDDYDGYDDDEDY